MATRIVSPLEVTPAPIQVDASDVTSVDPRDVTIAPDPAAEAALDRAPGVPLYQVAPGRPQKELPPIGAKGKDLGRFSGDYAVGQNIQSGYQSGLAGVDHLIGNISGMIAASSTVPGAGFGGEEIFKHIGNWAREQQKYREEKAAEYAGGRQDLPSKVIRGATSAVTSLPVTAAATALGGPVLGMAGLGGLETADQGPWNMLKGAAEGAAMGKFIHILGPAGRAIRIPAVAAVEYAKNVAQGVDHETALANALNMAGLTAIGGPGEVSARELPGRIAQDMIPDRFWKPIIENRLNPMEQASQDFLTKRGVQTPVSMQTGDPRAAGVEGAVRKSLGGGYATQVGEQTRAQVHRLGPEEFSRIAPEVTPEQAGAAVRTKLAGDLEQTRSTLAGQVSPTASTPELAGSKVLGAGKKAIQDLDKRADQSYKSAWEAERDPRNIEQVQSVNPDGSPSTVNMPLPIDMGDLREALKPLADQYEYTLSDTDARASLGLKTMRQIINGPRIKPARAAELDLGMLKEAANNENLPELRDQSQGLAAASVKQLQQAIDAKLAKAHYPGWDGNGTSPALRHLQAGRAATAQKYEVRDVFKGFGRKIEDVEPVAAFKRMTWSGDAGIEHLRDVARIAPEQMPEVGRAFIDNGGKWEGLGAETKKILFRDPELIKNLDDYYTKHAKFSGLTDMEPVALFDKLTAQRGQSNQLLQDVAEQAPEQMPGLLRAFVGELWGRVTREGNIQKVQGTLDKWLTMDQKTKDLLVGDPDLIKDLDSLFFSLKRLTHEVNPSGSGYIIALNKMKSDLLKGVGLVGGGALGLGGGAAGASVGAGAGMMAGVGMEVLMNKAMARLLFDPKFTKLLTEGIKLQTKGDTTGANLVGDALSRMAAASGLRDKLKEGLKKVVEDEEGSLKIPSTTDQFEPFKFKETQSDEGPSWIAYRRTGGGPGNTGQVSVEVFPQSGTGKWVWKYIEYDDQGTLHRESDLADTREGAQNEANAYAASQAGYDWEPPSPPSTPPGGGGQSPPAGQGGGIREQLQARIKQRIGEFASSEEGSSPRRRPAEPIAAVSLKYLMDNPLDVPGRGESGQVKTVDVGRQIRQTVRSSGGSLAPDSEARFRQARAEAAMVDDLNYALASQPEARKWYTESVQEMEAELIKNRPEFQDATKRSLFKYLLGVTSNGVDPETNFDAAVRGWDLYKEHGKFMAYDPGRTSELSNSGQVGLTFRANSYETAMKRLDSLVQDKGEAGAVKWLKSKQTIEELKKYDPKITVGDGSPRYGSYVLGEKVGAFGANLNGIYTELTADKWWSRTWNRWMGTTIATDREGKFKYDKTGEPLTQDDPRNETERALMRESAASVAKDLNLTVAELQAVLWYAEQALYRAHGLSAGSADYSMAAKKYFSKVSKRSASSPGSRPAASPSPPPSGSGPSPFP